MSSNSFEETMTGGFDGLFGIRNWLQSFAMNHYYVLYAIIIVLVVYLIISSVLLSREHFNPTASKRYSDSDQFGLGSKEHAASGAPAQPGSASYAVLHSQELDCANRKPVAAEPWDWLQNEAKTGHEPMDGSRPKTDYDFSKILAGH